MNSIDGFSGPTVNGMEINPLVENLVEINPSVTEKKSIPFVESSVQTSAPEKEKTSSLSLVEVDTSNSVNRKAASKNTSNSVNEKAVSNLVEKCSSNSFNEKAASSLPGKESSNSVNEKAASNLLGTSFSNSMNVKAAFTYQDSPDIENKSPVPNSVVDNGLDYIQYFNGQEGKLFKYQVNLSRINWTSNTPK